MGANYQTFLNEVSEGDFVIIGFGHNDEKGDDIARFTSALKDINEEGSFKKSLYDNYIKIALDKKATPIICSPIPRLDLSMSMNVSLAARGLILMPNVDYVCASKKLPDGEKKDNLVKYIESIRKPGHGYILRTQSISTKQKNAIR